MHSTITAPSNPQAKPKPIPPLHPGDRLTRDEFERRYEAMPSHVKAELVEGIVYMPSPVTLEGHADPQFKFVWWLGNFFVATPGTQGGDNATIRLDLDNEPQPDAFLRILPQHGGQSYNDGQYIGGAVELVAEVAASSASYDLHDKLNAYRRNGIREYIVWRTWDMAIDWFVLRDGRYDPLSLVEGTYRSEVFPGLYLAAEALIAGDMATVKAAADRGLQSPEHAEFVAKLAAARRED